MKSIFKFVFGIAFLLVLFGFLAKDLTHFQGGVLSFLKEHTPTELKDSLKEIQTSLPDLPNPLVQKGENEGFLESSKIILHTNSERTKEGKKELKKSALLTQIASKKAEDMFKNGYFEHVSPEGKGPAELAKENRYEYISIGENLALGIFKDEADLVKAWMDSPGHRENILSDKYTEIGVVARKGIYKGESVWISVQEFGRPLSDCGSVSETERERIKSESEALARLSLELEKLKKEADSGDSGKVSEYNMKAEEYNQRLRLLKASIKAFNKTVDSFNECTEE